MTTTSFHFVHQDLTTNDVKIMMNSIMKGNVNGLRMMMSKWSWTDTMERRLIARFLCTNAAACGQLECVKYLCQEFHVPVARCPQDEKLMDFGNGVPSQWWKVSRGLTTPLGQAYLNKHTEVITYLKTLVDKEMNVGPKGKAVMCIEDSTLLQVLTMIYHNHAGEKLFHILDSTSDDEDITLAGILTGAVSDFNPELFRSVLNQFKREGYFDKIVVVNKFDIKRLLLERAMLNPAMVGNVKVLVEEVGIDPSLPIGGNILVHMTGHKAVIVGKCQPIHFAAIYGNLPALDYLLSTMNTPHPEHVQVNGDTLLHLACAKKISKRTDMDLLAMTKYLVEEKKIDVTTRNIYGQTASDVARINDAHLVYAYLIGEQQKKANEVAAALLAQEEAESQREEEKQRKKEEKKKNRNTTRQLRLEPTPAPTPTPTPAPDEDDDDDFYLEGAPRHLVCPITLTLLLDPVVAADSFSYNRAGLEDWIDRCIKKGKAITSPTTNMEMMPTFTTNQLVKTMVKEYVSERRKERKSIR
jgi:hypothetical protein